MTSEQDNRTLVEQAEEDAVGRIELAAARASTQALDLLHSALEESGLRQKDLAAALGVTEGRVSQVLGGDGNMRITTLARVLRASGYRLQMQAQPTDAEFGSLPVQGWRRAPSGRRSVFAIPAVVTTTEAEGVGERSVVILSQADPTSYLDNPRVDWRRTGTGVAVEVAPRGTRSSVKVPR